MTDREPNYRREKGDAPVYQGLSIDQWARQSVQTTIREKTKEELEEKKPEEDLLSMLKLLEKNGVKITPSILEALTGLKQSKPLPEPEPEPEEEVTVNTEDLSSIDLLESIKVAAEEIKTRVSQMKRGIVADAGVSISEAASNSAAHITTLVNVLIEREKTKTPPPTFDRQPEEELTPQQKAAITRKANKAKKS